MTLLTRRAPSETLTSRATPTTAPSRPSSASADAGLFSPPLPVNKKRGVPKTLRYGQGCGDSAAVVARMQATRKHTLLTSMAQLGTDEDEAESSEDDDDERIASLHMHREIDERAALLTPLLEHVDGVGWRAKRGMERLGKSALQRPATQQTLDIMHTFNATKLKAAERDAVPRAMLQAYGYLRNEDDNAALKATYAPNHEQPPLRTFAPDMSSCLGCAYCDGVGPTFDQLQTMTRAAVAALPASTFKWRHAEPVRAKKRRAEAPPIEESAATAADAAESAADADVDDEPRVPLPIRVVRVRLRQRGV
jgi:hypothetical protein